MNVFIGFLKKELNQSWRDPAMQKFLFLIPVIQLLVFGFALDSDVKNVRIHFLHKPHDIAFSDIKKKILASSIFIPTDPTYSDPYKVIENNEADVVLIAPEETLTRAQERRRGEIQLLINAMNAPRAQAIENFVNSIVHQSEMESPFRFEIRILYNPELESSIYLVPGVFVMILNLLTIIMVSMSIAKEKESGTFETLLSMPIQNWEILLGKVFPFLIIGIFNMCSVLWVAILIFHLPVRGSIFTLFFSCLNYICTTISIGVLISTLAKNQQQAMMGAFLFLFPAMLLSGMMFPVENMPLVLKYLAYCNPMTHFLNILRILLLKGGEPLYILKQNGILILIAFLCSALALHRFRGTLN